MPHVLAYRDAISPRIVKQSDGKYFLLGIPIFECHDREDIHCDEQWMAACVEDQKAKKEKGFLPRLIIGHTSGNPADPEKPVVAYLDNYRFNDGDKWLYADYVDVPADLVGDFKANKWPGRSVEANREKPAIDVVALLGGTPPYFKLPDIKYSADRAKVNIIFSECHMATHKEKSKLRQLYDDMKENPTAQVSGGESSAEEADFKRFCGLMKRFAESLANDKPDADVVKNADSPTDKPEEQEQEKKEDYQYPDGKNKSGQMAAIGAKRDDPHGDYHPSKLSDDAARLNYAEHPEFKKLMARVDRLEVEKNALVDDKERLEWSQKYSALPIPADRLNVDDRVKFIMDLPNDKRQSYFDQSVRDIASPSVAPIHNDAPVTGTPKAGSDEESRAIRQLYEARRDVYRGDFARAQRDYRAGVRVGK